MNEERIKELFENEEFVKELFSKETAEEAQAFLAENDVEMSVEDLRKVMEKVNASLEDSDEDATLEDDDLEDVAGGSIIALGIMVAVCLTVVIGAGYHKEWAETGRKPRW